MHRLNRYRWWRRLRGGTWHYVNPRWSLGMYWIREEPFDSEIVLWSEVYP